MSNATNPATGEVVDPAATLSTTEVTGNADTAKIYDLLFGVHNTGPFLFAPDLAISLAREMQGSTPCIGWKGSWYPTRTPVGGQPISELSRHVALRTLGSKALYSEEEIDQWQIAHLARTMGEIYAKVDELVGGFRPVRGLQASLQNPIGFNPQQIVVSCAQVNLDFACLQRYPVADGSSIYSMVMNGRHVRTGFENINFARHWDFRCEWSNRPSSIRGGMQVAVMIDRQTVYYLRNDGRIGKITNAYLESLSEFDFRELHSHEEPDDINVVTDPTEYIMIADTLSAVKALL